MKAMALFPDGFRTDQNPKRQTVQNSLLRMSFFKIHILGQTVQSILHRLSFTKIHFLAYISGYHTPSPVCHCPILVRKPSGLVFPFKFKESFEYSRRWAFFTQRNGLKPQGSQDVFLRSLSYSSIAPEQRLCRRKRNQGQQPPN